MILFSFGSILFVPAILFLIIIIIIILTERRPPTRQRPPPKTGLALPAPSSFPRSSPGHRSTELAGLSTLSTLFYSATFPITIVIKYSWYIYLCTNRPRRQTAVLCHTLSRRKFKSFFHGGDWSENRRLYFETDEIKYISGRNSNAIPVVACACSLHSRGYLFSLGLCIARCVGHGHWLVSFDNCCWKLCGAQNTWDL